MTDDKTRIEPTPSLVVRTELGADELELALTEEDVQLRLDTIPDGSEYLGTYDSLEDYMRAMLEPEVSRGCQWILDCIDWSEVRRRFESDGSRLVIEQGHLYRLSLAASPHPASGDDPPPPWMPTRGGV